MKNQLGSASSEVRQTFVDNGSVVIFEDNHDGSYTRLSAEKYFGNAETDVSTLPKHTMQLSDLPKTRTGKIMRRLLKSKLLGQNLGDLSSLENPNILDEIPRLG